MMMAGCAKNMTETPEAGAVGTLYATVEGSDNTTRVGFDKNGTFYWSDGDQIGVVTDVNPKFTPLTIDSGAGTGSASFSGEVDGSMDGGYAVYPYSESHSVSGSNLTYTFPSEYTYTKVDTDFFSAEQGYGNSFNAPMWGKIDGNSVQFKHLGGVFCVKIDKMPLESGKVTFSADQKINGTYDIELSGSEPKFKAVAASTESEKSVTITFEGATTGESGVFYVPVPTGTYTNVMVSISDFNDSDDSNDSNDSNGGYKISIPCGNYNISRAMLKAIYPAVATGGTITANSADAVYGAFNKGQAHILVTPNVTDIDKINGIGEDGDINNGVLSYTQLPSYLTIGFDPNFPILPTLKFSVAMPYDETSESAPDVTINSNMSVADLTLAATAGKAVYGTVTSYARTIIIGNNVTVSELVVRGGDIRVKRGSHTKKIVIESPNTVRLYYEDGASFPTDFPNDKVIIVYGDN